MILPVAVAAALALRCSLRAQLGIASRTTFVVLLVLALAAMLAAACSSPEEEPAEQQAAAPQAQTRTPPSPRQEPAVQQEATAKPEPRGTTDAVTLLVAESTALEHNGYWEQALAVRESAIAAGAALDVDELTSLKLSRARLLLRLDRPGDAVAALAEIGGVLTAEHARRHALLRAQAALMLGRNDVAVEAMQGYVNSDSPAWAIISLEAARALQADGRGAEAIEWAERALGGLLPFQDRLRAIHLAGTELDISGESERALARYDELLRLSPWRDDQAAALSRIGVLQRDIGNIDAATEAWSTLVSDYREFSESSEALSFLLDAGVGVEQLTIGLIRFEEERWIEARQAMLNVLGGSDDVSERVAGEFYIAAIHQANGDLASAALGYVAVINRDATDPLSAEASMRLADFAVGDGDQIAAEEHWRRVMLEHPGHLRAAEAARRWASLAVARGQWSEAAQRFRDAANAGADYWGDVVRQELLYWAALMNREAGDLEAAADLAEKVVEIDPVGYYGLRALELLEQDDHDTLQISLEEWLTRLTGESDPSSTALANLSEWQAARDLRLGGFDSAADRMLSLLVDTLSNDPWSLVHAAETLAAQGEYTASAQAAAQVLILFGLNWTEAPPDLLRLAYPQPWPDVMALYAASEGLDPLLLWSLIRRESLYDTDAQGLAGEVGLTQVIPLTGSDIAAGLGIEYQHSDLARPELAIRFGAWYLARQLEGFSNEPVMALAAYNAGPGNAARWETEAVLGGPDGFLSALDFSSTRRYVHYVIKVLAVYEALERSEQAQ